MLWLGCLPWNAPGQTTPVKNEMRIRGSVNVNIRVVVLCVWMGAL